MRKFKPGGRCGGNDCDVPRETNPEFAGAYSALLAAREKQDTMWTPTQVQTHQDPKSQPQQQQQQPQPQAQQIPPLTQIQQPQQQLVVLPSQKPKENKKADIDFILDEF
jgi:hypothetical protein